MVLPDNVPDEADETARYIIAQRLPNYCHECAGEVVIAGGRLKEEDGFYPHIDPVAMCERGCWKRRFAAGVDQAEGQEFRQLAEDAHDTLFPDTVGWCDVHSTRMTATKDLVLSSSGGEETPVRQFKCPECDMECNVAPVKEDT